MNSKTNLSIELDMNKFKKISKKLQSKIYDKTEHDIKLSIIQEALSESMGFRNFNDFKNQNTNIALEKENISNNNNFLFFEASIKDNRKIIRTLHRNISHEERYSIPASSVMLLEILIENHKYFESCDFCLEKIKFLPFLKTIVDKKVVDNTDIFKEYFEYAFKSSNAYFDGEISHSPFNDIENTSQKRHDEAYDGLIRFLSIIDMIKNNNIIIYKRSWLAFNDFNSQYSGTVFYKDDIYRSPFYYKSWLHMESFFKLTTNLDYLNSSSFRMSDLLLHTANIISPSLKDNMRQLISILIDNYEDCIEISENFKDL